LSIADISLLSALLAGALSFLSPCVLPLVPPYLCYMAGISVEQFRGNDAVAVRRDTRGAVLLAAFCFTLGFATVFVALGAGASTIGMVLRRHLDILAQIGGVVIILMGLHFLGLLRIGLFSREARFQGGRQAGDGVGRLYYGACLRLRLDALHRPGAWGDPRRGGGA
jgi:cytochrome c-type biogenesis protein